MSAVQVNQKGDRIVTDILICGYVTQEIEDKYKLSIPSEIKRVCFHFWFINVCDQWDIESCKKHASVTFAGQIVKSSKVELVRNVFGCHTVSSGQFEWRLNWKKLNGSVAIGIIDNDKAINTSTGVGFTRYGNGAVLDIPNGRLYGVEYSWRKFGEKLDQNVENVDIKVKIDLDERSLYFAINEDEYKKTIYELKKDTSFRLALTFARNSIAEVELL